MELRSTIWIKLLFGLVLAFQAYRAASQPIRPAEAYLYDRFVRPSTRQVLAEELPNHQPLYTVLEKRSIGLFHVSPFAVRLPSLMFGALCLWSAWQFGWIAGALAAVAVTAWGGFAVADGTGGAIALFLFGAQALFKHWNHKDNLVYLNLFGVALGLSVAARADLAIPIAVLLAASCLLTGWTAWADRVLIPAVVTAFILLILPISHAHAPAEMTPALTKSQASHLQLAMAALERATGGESASIAAGAEAQPVVNFYRAQHRLNHWQPAQTLASTPSTDYSIVRASTDPTPQSVVYRNDDFLVTRRRE